MRDINYIIKDSYIKEHIFCMFAENITDAKIEWEHANPGNKISKIELIEKCDCNDNLNHFFVKYKEA